MSEALILHELPASPNNVKVRIALHFKGLPFERRPMPRRDDGQFDRTEVLAVSGQPMTPVLRHGDTVVFDSSSILRYLEANFRSTPRLFSDSYETMSAIETWERYAKNEIAAPVGATFRQALSPEPDVAAVARASAEMHAATERIEHRLHESPWLVGETMTAADVIAGPFVQLAVLPPERAEALGPLFQFFARHFSLGDDRDRTRDWVRRVLSYDKD